MINAQTAKLTRIKEIFFSITFTAFAVYTPMLVHYFAGVDGGRIFLPMPFFVLLAGITLGWRVGIATAVMSPLVSFLISGMPAINILSFIMLQLVAYGFVAGTAREKYHPAVVVFFSILAGWAIIGIMLFFFSKMNAANYVIAGLKAGFPGILLQMILLPFLALYGKKCLENEKHI